MDRRQSWDTSSYDNGSLKGTKWVSAVLEKHLPLPESSLSRPRLVIVARHRAGPANCIVVGVIRRLGKDLREDLALREGGWCNEKVLRLHLGQEGRQPPHTGALVSLRSYSM